MINNDLRLELLFLLYQKGRKIKALSKSGNTDKALQTIILRSLVDREMDVTQIAKYVCTNLSSVSELVEKLAKEGMIEKTAADDKRYANVRITEVGKSALKMTQELMKEHCISVFSSLTDQEVNSTINVLNKIL
jgi:DNA-binding MarR family transcriptional regulator